MSELPSPDDFLCFGGSFLSQIRLLPSFHLFPNIEVNQSGTCATHRNNNIVLTERYDYYYQGGVCGVVCQAETLCSRFILESHFLLSKIITDIWVVRYFSSYRGRRTGKELLWVAAAGRGPADHQRRTSVVVDRLGVGIVDDCWLG